MIAFDRPLPYEGPLSLCLPDNQIYFNVVAPFRADLDPSRGGQIRYGTLAGGRTFVLSYENIPLHDGPLNITYTFQVLLHNDGRIGFQYKTLGALPNRLSVGVQYSRREVQEIGCGATSPISDGLAIELRPQVPSDSWMTDDPSEGTIQPGGRQVLRLALVWTRPLRTGPYRGQIEITSSAPTNPSMILPVQVDIRAAPYELWINPVYAGS
jgi:hypothetical protein